ncbi:MAG: sulfite exporter TauE/SafE family protein [Coprobacillaceae bacterium]
MILIYSIVIFIATFLGALAGLGGGVIIKPVLDLINYHSLTNISFLSTVAVTSMAIISLIKQRNNRKNMNLKVLAIIAFASMLGGIIGNILFDYCLAIFPETAVRNIQAVLLNGLLVFVIISVYKHLTWKVNGVMSYIIIGLLLGTFSSFLGIGGGPINVAVFTIFLGMDVKKATLYSIATILFSQLSKLGTIALTTGFQSFDIEPLLYVIPTALLGGVFGSYYNQKLSNKQVANIFIVTMLIIICMNCIILYINL